jgi:hypothetical protein
MVFESEKIVIFADEGNRILTHKGFKKINSFNNYTIRLFNHIQEAKDYLNKYVSFSRLEVEFKKVKINYEVLE